jgi:beta-phosphoglucomutase-like phosphatase (HAD superfamily)
MKLILFDLDGTLVDSAPAVAEAINRVRARKDLVLCQS